MTPFFKDEYFHTWKRSWVTTKHVGQFFNPRALSRTSVLVIFEKRRLSYLYLASAAGLAYHLREMSKLSSETRDPIYNVYNSNTFHITFFKVQFAFQIKVTCPTLKKSDFLTFSDPWWPLGDPEWPENVTIGFLVKFPFQI